MEKDFKTIKKLYGEKFAQYCKENFPTILLQEGLLPQILEERFAHNRYLYEDFVKTSDPKKEESFQAIILNTFRKHQDIDRGGGVIESPEELFKKAGYTLYYCKNWNDVLSFKKYYRNDEELCTFHKPDRLYRNHIYFAVKDNVDEIKREDFLIPKRDDVYGTSVISLQFDKTTNRLSIKNRYNHNVVNPDATFDNDLENIYKGLTTSFYQHKNIDVFKVLYETALEGYIKATDGKYYKYNVLSGKSSCCINNVVLDESYNPIQYKSDRYELIDNYILDKQAKTIKSVNAEYHDSFLDFFQDIKKINIVKDESKLNRIIQITTNNNE